MEIDLYGWDKPILGTSRIVYRVINKKGELVHLCAGFPEKVKNPEDHYYDRWTGAYAQDGKMIFENDIILGTMSGMYKRKTKPKVQRSLFLVRMGETFESIGYRRIHECEADLDGACSSNFRTYPHLRTIDRYNIDNCYWWKEDVEHHEHDKQTKIITGALMVVGTVYSKDFIPDYDNLIYTEYAKTYLKNKNIFVKGEEYETLRS